MKPLDATHKLSKNIYSGEAFLKQDQYQDQWYAWELNGGEWLPVDFPDWLPTCYMKPIGEC